MKKFKLTWMGGDSRLHPGKVADCMRVETDKGELYAEALWGEGEGEADEQVGIFWDCMNQIVKQATEKGIPLDSIELPAWDYYGDPASYFSSISDVPEALRQYLSVYFK